MNIEHVAMYVNDPDAARDFFIKYLGARSNGGYRNPNTGFRSYFLSFDGGARLEIMSRPGMAEGTCPHRLRAHRFQHGQSGECGRADRKAPSRRL